MKWLPVLCSLPALCVTAAYADPPHGKGHGNGHWKHHEEAENSTIYRFSDHDRPVIYSYLNKAHRSHCPPGLAKKHNGCLPPGQAKRYAVGQELPAGFHPVPANLLSLIGPAPNGTYYAMSDNDVALVSNQNQQILDIISLMSGLR